MDQAQFRAALEEDGFGEIVTVTRETAGSLDRHRHPFDARALILEGDITLEINDTRRCYGAGDVFLLPANTEHREFYGPQGVKYLVGRKARA